MQAFKAPTYVERNIDTLRQRELTKKHHYDKLAQLSQIEDVKTSTRQQYQQYEKVKQMRQKVQKFDQQEKNTAINRNNQILLNKLVEISSGKWSSVQMAPKRVRAMLKQNRSMAKNISLSNVGPGNGSTTARTFAVTTKSHSVGPRSLNISVRKQENERIERENQAFAKRLFDNGGAISKKSMDKDYYNHTQYKNNIMKVNKPVPGQAYGQMSRRRLPGTDGRLTQLPPLNPHSLTASRDITNRNSATQNDFADKGDNLDQEADDLVNKSISNSPKKDQSFDQRNIQQRQSFERPKAASEQPNKSPTRPKLPGVNKQASIKSKDSDNKSQIRASKDSKLSGASIANNTIKEEAKENVEETKPDPVKKKSTMSVKSQKSKAEKTVEDEVQVEAPKQETPAALKSQKAESIKEPTAEEEKKEEKKEDDDDDNYSDDVDQQEAPKVEAQKSVVIEDKKEEPAEEQKQTIEEEVKDDAPKEESK